MLTANVYYFRMRLAALAARTTPAQTQPERDVALLTISFAAVGPDGHCPRGLKPEEVTIKIDGRERAIRSLQSNREHQGASCLAHTRHAREG